MTDPSPERRPVLVTGAAGFIGFHVARVLLDAGTPVIGVDSMNAYYDPRLKEARLRELEGRAGFAFQAQDLADRQRTAALFAAARPARVLHMAAQAGVRYSLVDPHAYMDANIVGFLNVLEGCRRNGVEHLTYASSSSVYGANTKMPFSVHDNVDHPVSLYAASKKANELMAHSYSHLYGLPTTGLRFFTVYGPWGRPDMALFIFTKAILEGRPIQVFNEGRMRRDFTYIDDVVEGVLRASERVPAAQPAVGRRTPRPRQQHGALSALQHRQQRAGGPDACHRHAGGGARAQGPAGAAADAAGRRGRDLCRCGGPRARRGLQAGDADRDGDCALRGVVSGVLRGLILACIRVSSSGLSRGSSLQRVSSLGTVVRKHIEELRRRRQPSSNGAGWAMGPRDKPEDDMCGAVCRKA